jgi:hypothetical protein
LSNLCNVSEVPVPPFQLVLHPRVLKIVARSKVGQVGVVGHNNHFVFSLNLPDAEGRVGSVIVMVQEPIPALPLGGSFCRRLSRDRWQRIQVTLLTYCYFLEAQTPVNIRKEVNIVLMLEGTCYACFGFSEFGEFS